MNSETPYRGRLAPSPTGLLHIGHARTFYLAYRRAREQNGSLVLRNDDLDRGRSRTEFAQAAMQDLRALGIEWQEGPDIGGPYAPYNQSERQHLYLDYWRRLHAIGCIYPCEHSRKDIVDALQAPHEDDTETNSFVAHSPVSGEQIYPMELRPPMSTGRNLAKPGNVNWRFRLPYGDSIEFYDEHYGRRHYVAGRDFGDFLVWRKDGYPSYEFAVVIDDLEMRISEIVRGSDLLLSTARQLCIYRKLHAPIPKFYHCELVRNADGRRLAKRDSALTIREVLKRVSPEELRTRLLETTSIGGFD